MITDIEGMLSKTAVHLEVWSTLSPNLVSNMERGVVFIYASWSGYAKASLLTLARVAAVTNAPFSLAIVNHDAVDPDSFESVLSMFPTGQGETFAVKCMPYMGKRELGCIQQEIGFQNQGFRPSLIAKLCNTQ